MTPKKHNIIIIGSGIVGLTIAYKISELYPNIDIAIIEKESDVAFHASGRNSGVLHAGFYYTPESLKAKFTAEGNKLMKAFCKEHHIPVLESKKLVVAQNKEELETLEELYRRGKQNNVDLSLIDEEEAKKIEPECDTYKKALYSPSTASVNPKQVCLKFKNILLKKNVTFYFNETITKVKENMIKSKKNSFSCDYFINCAGLYADKIAHQQGIGKEYTMLPFKGLYLKYSGDNKALKTNIYPVPNILNPFLGVHYTITASNDIKIGPTATPGFWKEHYKGFKNFKLGEFIEISIQLIKLFIGNHFNFRKLAFSEIKKYSKKHLINEANKLLKTDMKEFTFIEPGIRAQLFNKKEKKLEMDFIIKCTKNSMHVLNAVSPAFTSSLSFAQYAVDQIKDPLKKINS